MLGLSCIYIWFAYSLFVNQNFILDIPYVVLNSLACYLIVNAYNEIMTNKEFKRLLLLSTTDGLTGLNIIRHFNMLYEAFFKEALAQKRELHIILIDIDNFKSINDTYGHQVGDLVLKEVAKIVKGGCRKLDIPARYGGEEFIIMAMDTNKFGALKLAERIRRNVEKNIVKAAEGNIKVTISIGVGGLRKEDQQKEDLIKRSDASLYESKRNGKNRVSYG